MKVNAHLDTNKLSDIAEQAARAEALGFDSLALAELTLDPFLSSTLAAQHTPKRRHQDRHRRRLSPQSHDHGLHGLEHTTAGRR